MKKEELIKLLESRFLSNMHRHENISWEKIYQYLNENETALQALSWMEESGGKPDLVSLDDELLIYVDMAKESPKDRRSLCYDKKARLSRKKNPPQSSVLEECDKHGLVLVDEEIYKHLQNLEDIDLKTSSWLKSPEEIRELGGAIFGDKRYKRTFIYHNGADSYYGSRGFRAFIEI
ncbi:MAG: DUF4256 domain-containing protein [Tissierellia bacterium]|nr:DUF4256 domain-containing protein [Tissierellia bacterium]